MNPEQNTAQCKQGALILGLIVVLLIVFWFVLISPFNTLAARIKWSPFCSRHFQKNFHKWTLSNFNQTFTDVCCWGSNHTKISRHGFRQWLGNELMTEHYLIQCWPRLTTPYGVTRPQVSWLSGVWWRTCTSMNDIAIYFGKKKSVEVGKRLQNISHFYPKVCLHLSVCPCASTQSLSAP